MNLFYGVVIWVHLDMRTTCPSSYVKPVLVATVTARLETVTAEAC